MIQTLVTSPPALLDDAAELFELTLRAKEGTELRKREVRQM